MDIKKLETIFSFGRLQDLLTLIRFIEKNDISLEEVLSFIKKKKLEYLNWQRTNNRYERRVLRCPECGLKMNLHPVNTNKRDQTGDDSQSVWLCFNKECMETIYNKESVQDIYSKLSRKEVKNV